MVGQRTIPAWKDENIFSGRAGGIPGKIEEREIEAMWCPDTESGPRISCKAEISQDQEDGSCRAEVWQRNACKKVLFLKIFCFLHKNKFESLRNFCKSHFSAYIQQLVMQSQDLSTTL